LKRFSYFFSEDSAILFNLNWGSDVDIQCAGKQGFAGGFLENPGKVSDAAAECPNPETILPFTVIMFRPESYTRAWRAFANSRERFILTFPPPSTKKSNRPQVLHNHAAFLCCGEARF
jgi:hypothetical protein